MLTFLLACTKFLENSDLGKTLKLNCVDIKAAITLAQTHTIKDEPAQT